MSCVVNDVDLVLSALIFVTTHLKSASLRLSFSPDIRMITEYGLTY